MKVNVVVMPKGDVLDPQGKAVGGALHSLGYNEVQDVRIGRIVELNLEDGLDKAAIEERVGQMCQKLLANTVIEDFTFAVSE